MNRKLTPQMPGEPVKTADIADDEIGTEEVLVDVEEPTQPVEPEPEPVKAARPAARARPANSLPDQSEIDPHKIDRAVLTRQGWVVPIKPVSKER